MQPIKMQLKFTIKSENSRLIKANLTKMHKLVKAYYDTWYDMIL